jgi:polyvinyl alcohol dehydrogenase (cytochrome)
MANRGTESKQHLEPARRAFHQSHQRWGLSTKWVFTTGGDVSATPTVDGDAVYFPDWGGNLFAVEKQSGRLIWSHKISDYDGVAGAISRVSPAIDGEQLIIGDIQSSNKVHNGANVISVDRKTGGRRWITQVDPHQAAIITGSPVVFDGVVYIGSHRLKKPLRSIQPIRAAAFGAAS